MKIELRDIDALRSRYLPSEAGVDYLIQPLERGMSNFNLKVTPQGESVEISPMVLTIYGADDLWKIEQELLLRSAVSDQSLLPQILDYGLDTVGDHEIGFILRRFIEGIDLDLLMSKEEGPFLSEKEKAKLMHDLGVKLGRLNQNSLPFVGFIGRETTGETWKQFIEAEIREEMEFVQGIPNEKTYGSLTGAAVKDLLDKLVRFFGDSLSALETVKKSQLAHGDPKFSNIIAGKSSSEWGINGFVDTEWALAGDQEVDLAFIESWLFCAPYREEFKFVSEFFQQGYSIVQTITPLYKDKRLVYHAWQSLIYLRVIFGLDKPADFAQQHPASLLNVIRHFQILQSLAEGNNLGELEVPALS